MLTGPSLFIAAVAPIAGYVVDSIGRKLVLVISTLVYGISGLAGYLAPTLTWLLVSRAALGIFVSPIIGQPMVAAMGFRTLCLGVGVLLLTMAALFWVARNQLRSLADRTPLELRSPDTDMGTGEAQTAAKPA
jgi:predicted MFS family arabinose efflux permease